MNETPIKAQRRGAPKGELKTGHFWPIGGDTDIDCGGGDPVFILRSSRAALHEGLGETAHAGQLVISDGYSASFRDAEQAGNTSIQTLFLARSWCRSPPFPACRDAMLWRGRTATKKL